MARYGKISVIGANSFTKSKVKKLVLPGNSGNIVDNPDFVFTVDTTQAGSASDTVVLPLLSGGTYSGTIDWGDGSTSVLSYANRTHVYSSSGTYTITISGTIEGWRFAATGDRLKILDVSNWGNLNITTGRAFQFCENLDISATDHPILSSSDSASSLFQSCNLTNVDFSTWDFSSCTNFKSFLNNNPSFIGNVEGIIHVGVTSISTAFGKTALGNQDFSTWDVVNISGWFEAFRDAGLGENADFTGWVPSGALTNTFIINPLFKGDGLDTWNIGGITSVNFASCTLSTANYDALLVAWEAQSPSNAVTANFGSSTYTSGSAAATARASLISTFGWTITDGGAV